VVAGQLLGEALAVRSPRAALALGVAGGAPQRAARVLTRTTDFCNLFLRRR
jgi:hypothetical protein